MEHKELVEKILKLFSISKDTLRLNEISKMMNIKSESPEYLILKSVLTELSNQKVLLESSRRRYSLNNYESVTTLEGVVKIKSGAGFVTTNAKVPQKIRIKRRHLNTAFNGDTVLVRIISSKKSKKLRGEIVSIIERNNKTIKGIIEVYDNINFFIPDDENFYVDFIIDSKKMKGAKDGDKVEVKFLYWDDPQKSPQAEVEKLLSSSDSKNEILQEFDSILDEFNLPHSFDDKILKYTNAIEKPDIKQIVKKRLDLRKELIITIDPHDAKDFDDALSLTILKNGNYYLGVHIADVSHFVEQDSNLDKEAFKRGNSIYLVDRVIPMLPERLSNDLCSLKPNRVRLSYSVMMELNPKGVVVGYEIAESIIKSKRRYSYEEVQGIIDSGKGDNYELISSLHKLTSLLRASRFRLGGVDFESTEIKFELDENKNPVQAYPKTSTPSTQLVEECMLLANKTVALHIQGISKKWKFRAPLPFFYRVHDVPNPDKLADNIEFLKSLGLKITKKPKTSREINYLVKQFKDRPEKPVVHQIMLRSMAKAQYSNHNIGHFGLGFTDYAHFTSPIRRYPDLIVHRILKEYAQGKPQKHRIGVLDNYLDDAGHHCTETEREAMDAERSSIRLVQTLLARKYLGQEIEGTISGVTSFGIFVLLDKFYGEGLLYARDLRDDYYYYDEKHHRMVGRRKKKIFKLGGKVIVRIIHVNVENRKIELEFIEKLK